MINDNSSQWTPFQLDRVIRGHLLIVPLWFDGNAAEGMESSRPKRRWDQLQQWQWGEARCLKKGHPKNGDFNRKKHGWWGAIHPLTCTVLWPYILSLHLAFSVKFHEVLGSLIFWRLYWVPKSNALFRATYAQKGREQKCWMLWFLLNQWSFSSAELLKMAMERERERERERWSTLVGLSGLCPRLKVSRLTYPTPANLDGVCQSMGIEPPGQFHQLRSWALALSICIL